VHAERGDEKLVHAERKRQRLPSLLTEPQGKQPFKAPNAVKAERPQQNPAKEQFDLVEKTLEPASGAVEVEPPLPLRSPKMQLPSPLAERRGQAQMLRIIPEKKVLKEMDTDDFGTEVWETKRPEAWLEPAGPFTRATTGPASVGRTAQLGDARSSGSDNFDTPDGKATDRQLLARNLKRLCELSEEQKAKEHVRSFLSKRGFKNAAARHSELLGRSSCPLHCAVRSNDAEMVRLLLHFKADPRLANSAGLTAYAYAKERDVEGSHEEVLASLKAALEAKQ